MSPETQPAGGGKLAARWRDAVLGLGLSAEAAPVAANYFAEVEARYELVVGDPRAARAWWVPGRIEVLGKHTDYGGGRSLLCAVERGFHVLAAPRGDDIVRIVDASTNATLSVRLDANAESRPGHWTDYPIAVVRRIARDFPEARCGMNAVIRSSLPSASGLSSSSALVIACLLPIAALNNLRESAAWACIGDADALAEYAGAVENGRAYRDFPADRGVGTQGGSEDQTAILRSAPGHLLQYHFVPVTREATIALPAGWQFVIGMSGVHAAKGAAMQARYNALAGDVAALLATWQRRTGRTDASLFAALDSAPDAATRLAALVSDSIPDSVALRARLAQFRRESFEIIPGVARLLADADVPGIGELVDESQRMAETVLHNQVAETVHLAQHARELGAAAASAFGAGFGGSVWALVRDADAERFRTAWRDDYLSNFPQRRARAEFFPSRPGPAAQEIPRLP
jgi:galactokinase